MGRIQYYERPETLEQAVSLLVEKRGKACVLAGGTSLAVRMPPGIDTFVDLSGTGLAGIEDRGASVAIKACTTVAELAESRVFKNIYGGLFTKAALAVASTPLRNMITVGGNAVQVLPWSDLPGVFLAVNAEMVIDGPNPRVLPASEFYSVHPRTFLETGDILTEIRVPKPVGRVEASFKKVAKTKFDYAALSVTTVLWCTAEAVRECSVSLGSVRPLPLRVPQAEEEITGRDPIRDDLVRAAARAAGAIEPSQDYRYSKEYRRQLIKVWVKRCLLDALR